MHVQVLVGPQAAAEEHLVVLGLRGRELAISLQLLAILRGVDRVVRLVIILREAGVLLDDDRLVLRVLILALRVEVTELVDAGVRDVRVVVVHHRGALKVAGVQHLLLKVEGAPAQVAFRVVEVAVQRAGVDHRRLRGLGAQLVADLEPVGVEANLDVLVIRHVLQPLGVALDRQALVGVVEVAVVEGVAHRQAGNVGRRQLLRVGLPLLGGVVADEGLVERTADQRDALLLEVLGIPRVQAVGLVLDQLAGLVRAVVLAEELVDQAQAHRELVGGALVHREDSVLVVGEVRELVDVVPHPLVGGVEEVGAVLVDFDARGGLGLRVGIAPQVVAAFDDQDARVVLRGGALGNGQAEEAGADNNEVIFPVCAHVPQGTGWAGKTS